LEFNFPTGLNLIDGLNASGKSNLLTAVCYALYGSTPKESGPGKAEISISELIKDDSSYLETQIAFEAQGELFEVKRHRSLTTTNIDILVNGIKKDLSKKESDLFIAKAVGLTFEQFIKIVYVFQDSSERFISLNDPAKKAFLSGLLNLDAYDKAYFLAHTDLIVAQEKQTILNVKLESSQAALNKERELLKTYELKLAEYQDESYVTPRNIQLEGLLQDRAILIKQKESLQFNSAIEIASLIKEKEDVGLKLNASRESAKQFAVQNYQLKQFDMELLKFNKQLGNVPTECGECGQSIPEDKTNVYKRSIESKIDVIKQKQSSIVPIVLDTTNEKLLEEGLSSIESALRNRQSVIVQKGSEISTLDLRINTLKNELDLYHSKKNATKENVDRINLNISDYNAEIIKLSNEISELSINKAYLVEIKKLFSPTGIRSYIFDSLLSELNGRIEHYMNRLTDGDIAYLLYVDLNGKFKQRCSVGGKDRNVGMLSGGQFKKVALAVDFALSDVMLTRLEAHPDTLFLDEPFEYIDVLGKEKIMDLLVELSAKRSSIYVIDHASEFKSLFNNVVRVSVGENGTTIGVI
jgi:DNA repair exonuclease SbcCD ATPase subunit